MWHLEKAILEQLNTSENVSCLSLNDANTHFQTKQLVSTVTLFRFGRNPNENLFLGVQIVLIPVVCCRADEAVVSKQKQECEKETKEKHGAKQNMRMACIDVPVENTFSSTRVFLGSQLTNGKTKKNTKYNNTNSESIGPDYFSLPVQRWAKCQQDLRKQRAGFEVAVQDLTFLLCRLRLVNSSPFIRRDGPSNQCCLSSNQCSFGRCVSKCYLKSNNSFLPFFIQSCLPVVTKTSIGNKSNCGFAKRQKTSFCFFFNSGSSGEDRWRRKQQEER